MLTEAQQVAMIRTMLHFMGKSQYQPTASVVLAELRQFSAVGAGWDVAKNPMPGGAPPPSQWSDVKSIKR